MSSSLPLLGLCRSFAMTKGRKSHDARCLRFPRQAIDSRFALDRPVSAESARAFRPGARWQRGPRGPAEPLSTIVQDPGRAIGSWPLPARRGDGLQAPPGLAFSSPRDSRSRRQQLPGRRLGWQREQRFVALELSSAQPSPRYVLNRATASTLNDQNGLLLHGDCLHTWQMTARLPPFLSTRARRPVPLAGLATGSWPCSLGVAGWADKSLFKTSS